MTGAIVISGPTASGKSSLALDLANHFDIEIVSADSAQVYRGMDIGTAKPDRKTQERVVHHLIDIREPQDPYSAADFRTDSIRIVQDILSRDRVPVIAGGTMLYLKALKEGIAELPEANQSLRDEIIRQAEQAGWQSLHDELQAVDPQAAARIKVVDTQRLQRAIEVYRITGSPMSELHRKATTPCPFPLLEIAIMPPDRASLHGAIEQRLKTMFESGFIEEVQALKDNPAIHPGLPAIKAVGYRQVWSYLAGDMDKTSMFDAALAATRQLAKRQYTWLRGWRHLNLLEEPNTGRALKIIETSPIFHQ